MIIRVSLGSNPSQYPQALILIVIVEFLCITTVLITWVHSSIIMFESYSTFHFLRFLVENVEVPGVCLKRHYLGSGRVLLTAFPAQIVLMIDVLHGHCYLFY